MTSLNANDLPGAEPSDLKGLRILVVEDSWHLGMALKRLLLALGANVVGPAATTADAIHLITDQAPDVALVDINLRHGELAYGLIRVLDDHGEGDAVEEIAAADGLVHAQKLIFRFSCHDLHAALDCI